MDSTEMLRESLSTGDWAWIGGQEPEYHESDLVAYEEWQNQKFDDYLAYAMFSPSVSTLKIGIAKDFAALENRLAEKVRHCGETIVIGVAPCIGGYFHAKETEDRMIEWAKSHPFIKPLGKESFKVDDPSWMDDLLHTFCMPLERAKRMTNGDLED